MNLSAGQLVGGKAGPRGSIRSREVSLDSGSVCFKSARLPLDALLAIFCFVLGSGFAHCELL